jgi:hypothetical protein
VTFLTVQVDLSLPDLTTAREHSSIHSDHSRHTKDPLVHDEPENIVGQYQVPRQEDPQPYIQKFSMVTNKTQATAAHAHRHQTAQRLYLQRPSTLA